MKLLKASCLVRYFARGLALGALALGPSLARAQTTINIFTERQEEKKKARWTLADWMKQKQQISDQNAWLSRHTLKIPIDLALTAYVNPVAAGADFDFYLAWLGLRLRYEQPLDATLGNAAVADVFRNKSGQIGLQFRAFGGNLQNTNLIVRTVYEFSPSMGPNAIEVPGSGLGLGGELQIYFAEWIGARGDYLYRLKRKPDQDPAGSLSGSAWSAVAFLEINLFRLEAGWEARDWTFASMSDAAQDGKRSESGFVARTRIFF